MKSAAHNIIIFFLFLIAAVICMTIYGRETRKKELQSNVHNVAEQTVAAACATKEYEISGRKELIADFVENMSMNMVTDSDISVNVYGADAEKGLLSVNVVENYKHPTGADGKVEHSSTVILDKKVEVQETHTVDFYLDAGDTESYMSFVVYTGDMIITPIAPQKKNKTFVSWHDTNGYLADFTQPVEQDITYYATWH